MPEDKPRLSLSKQAIFGDETHRGKKIVLGIDPGLASVGYGVVAEENGQLFHLAHGCVTTQAGSPSQERLEIIYDALSNLFTLYAPSFGATESLYFFRNVSSALPVAEARGIIKLAFQKFHVPLSEYTPNEIKKAVCGTSRADKKQVQEMVRLLVGLSDIPKPDHAADALAAAICGIHRNVLQSM